MAIARQKGKLKGRKPRLTPWQARQLADLRGKGHRSICCDTGPGTEGTVTTGTCEAPRRRGHRKGMAAVLHQQRRSARLMLRQGRPLKHRAPGWQGSKGQFGGYADGDGGGGGGD